MSKPQSYPSKLLFLLLTFALFQGCATQSTKNKNESAPEAAATAETVKDGKFEVTTLIGYKVKKAALSNGLKILIVQDSSSPTFAYQTWFNVGSRNEVPGKTGLAHLFEHMMFKGTKNFKDGQFDALLEAAGVEGENAFTSNDHTVYVQELPKDQLDLIVKLESDRMVNLIVDDTSFKTEREVVQNERRFRKENSAEGILYETLFETLFKDHPYHWPVIGYEQDLNVMGAQDARDFYERFYSPERATIVIVGDVNADDVYRKLDRAYGSIPAKGTVNPEIKYDEPQKAQVRKKIPLNITSQKLWMAYHVPGVDSPDTPVLETIQAVISDGKNSRLDRALVDSGISTGASSGQFSFVDPTTFVIMTDLQKGKSAAVAESIILREIQRLKTTLVSDAELQRAKNLYRFHFVNKISTGNGLANFLGDSETNFGDFRKGIAFQNQVQEVTPIMIQEVIKKYFNSHNLTVLVGTPKNEK